MQRLLEDVEAIVTEMNRGIALEDVLQGSKVGNNQDASENRYFSENFVRRQDDKGMHQHYSQCVRNLRAGIKT